MDRNGDGLLSKRILAEQSAQQADLAGVQHFVS
jgi:hypothetical protein